MFGKLAKIEETNGNQPRTGIIKTNLWPWPRLTLFLGFSHQRVYYLVAASWCIFFFLWKCQTTDREWRIDSEPSSLYLSLSHCFMAIHYIMDILKWGVGDHLEEKALQACLARLQGYDNPPNPTENSYSYSQPLRHLNPQMPVITSLTAFPCKLCFGGLVTKDILQCRLQVSI